MFLHVIAPDIKFIGSLQHIFEAAESGRHVYTVYAPRKRMPRLELPTHVERVESATGLDRLLQVRDDWEGVIVNGVPPGVMVSLLQAIPERLSAAWYVWGREVYDYSPQLRRTQYLPETRRYAVGLRGALACIRNRWFRPAVRCLPAAQWIHDRVVAQHELRKVLDRYDYCVVHIPEEYELFRQHGLVKRTQYHWGAVAYLEDVVDVHAPIETPGPDIQLGNSSWMTNNHLDAFSRLSMLDLRGRTVVTPLSYGDVQHRDLVLRVGYQRLGEHFLPLTGFVPLADYNRLMQRCGTVVMNHCRQQAVGNIIAALWRGARVYLNDTTVYRGYRRLGFDVGLIERDVRPNNPNLFKPYSIEQIQRHRDILTHSLGREVVIRQTRDLLDRLASTGRARE